MKNKTRREFISEMLLILPAPFIADIVHASPQDKIDKIESDAQFIEECRIVYLEWEKREFIDPADYLQKIMRDSKEKKWTLSEATKIDFHNNNFFSVNGLQLGKTEAAFLALLGS